MRYASPEGGATTTCEPSTLDEGENFDANTSRSVRFFLGFFFRIANLAVGAFDSPSGRPRFGLTWPPVQGIIKRTQRRQDGPVLSHLVRASLQGVQLKGSFSMVAAAVFCFFAGRRPSWDINMVQYSAIK